jgi:ABC-type bacteriocin/lantibiotic exporter with double-glycine peptidase domain
MVRRAALGLAAAALAACSSYAGSARDFSPRALAREPGWLAVTGVPLALQQSESGCGAAAVAMVVSYWTGAAPARLIAEIGPVPERGLSAGRLREFARAHGLAAFLLAAEVADLEHELGRGRPVLVGLVKPQRRGVLTHYEVVVAVHPARRRVVTLDPAHGWRANSFEGFLREWRPVRGLALMVSARPRVTAPGAPRAAAARWPGAARAWPRPGARRPADRSGAPAPPARPR